MPLGKTPTRGKEPTSIDKVSIKFYRKQNPTTKLSDRQILDKLKRIEFKKAAASQNYLGVKSPEEMTLEMLGVVTFLDTPTPEAIGKIGKLLRENGAYELANRYSQLYDKAVRLESRIDEVPELLDSLIDTLSEKKNVLLKMKAVVSQMGSGIYNTYFNKKESETDATLKKYAGRAIENLTTWVSTRARDAREYVTRLLQTFSEGESGAVTASLSDLSLRLRQWATLQKIYNTGLPTVVGETILYILKAAGTAIISNITNFIFEPTSVYVKEALDVLYNVSTYLLQAFASINTGGIVGDPSAGSDIAALVLLCSIVFTMVGAKYSGGAGEETLRAKFDAIYDSLSSKARDLVKWCSEVPGRASGLITTVITYIQQTKVFNQVVGGFNLSVYLLTGIPLEIFSQFLVGTRNALYASIEELKRVYAAGNVEAANRQAKAIMADLQGRRTQSNKGGARKSKSRRRRGPTVNKKQKKSRRYKRSNNRGGSRKNKKATKKRRN
jgi:hypothetical protein